MSVRKSYGIVSEGDGIVDEKAMAGNTGSDNSI